MDCSYTIVGGKVDPTSGPPILGRVDLRVNPVESGDPLCESNACIAANTFNSAIYTQIAV